ncbi:hypothetical protein PsYK624_098460 [Phanerochaete sordida]|uniref:Uncharacterized protein n=1 Tax=Phanerochaete sordida TaxID=48140 RepID=A0A9P3LFM5_9APHY|nr:hypothetical protein PsYK624_098460 [Phanerochaete sordida]
MSDFKEGLSANSTYSYEYHEHDGLPAYEGKGRSSPRDPFQDPSSRGVFEGQAPPRQRSPYMPPAGPPPQFGGTTNFAQPEHGYYDQQPSYQGQGNSRMMGMSSPPPTSAFAPYAPSPTPTYQPAPVTYVQPTTVVADRYAYGYRGYRRTPLVSTALGVGPRSRRRGVLGLVGSLVDNDDDGARSMPSSTPPSFSRTPQPQFPYSPFPPLVAVSFDKHLDRGFPLAPPPSQLNPHPFMAHDVSEVDWTSFLGDIQQAGVNTNANTPVTVGRFGRPSLVGTLVSMGVDAASSSSRSGAVTQVVDQWNSYFFHPRQMEVNLAHGRNVYTTSGRLSPELVREGYVCGGSGQSNEPWKLLISSRPLR